MTGYTLALATVIPLTGWAADRLGTKRLFMGSVLAFTAGSLLCAAAPNIESLIGFRVLQGLARRNADAVELHDLDPRSRPEAARPFDGGVEVPMLLGPICGPILGGWLIGSYGWQWIFGINLPIGVVTFVLAAVVFPKDRPSPSETFDFVGILLLSPGLATFLYGVSSMPAHGTVIDRHVCDTRCHRCSVDLRVRGACAASRRPSADQSAAVQQSGVHLGQLSDVCLRDSVFRRRPADSRATSNRCSTKRRISPACI